MKDYEIVNTQSHAFQCDNYPEALEAIKEWWATVDNPLAVINTIVFHVEDEGVFVEVYYASG